MEDTLPDVYRPRLSVELSDEQYQGLQKRIPWGLQRHLFSAIIDDLLDILEKGDPEKIIGAMIAGIMKPRELLKTLNQENNNGNLN